MIRGPIQELTTSPAAGLTLVIGLATALWSASGYVTAFGRVMKRIYEIDEGRGFVKLRGTMLGVTLISVALLAAMLVISGPVAEAIGNLLGLGGVALSVWNIAKWPVIIALVVVIAILYQGPPTSASLESAG